MEEEKLKLSDYLIMCSEFEKDPTNTDILDGIDGFLSRLSIREYIPLHEKEIIMMNVLTSLNKDYDAPGTAVFLEIGKISMGLLAYCTNLENDATFLNYSYYIVDAIYMHGLYDIITAICEEDCNRLFKMIDDTINASNIYRITETASLFNQNSYDEWLKNMEDLKQTMDSQSIKDLLMVFGSGSQEAKDLLEQIQNVALESIKTDVQSESDKFAKAAEEQSENIEDSDKEDISEEDESIN